jgi:high-affinity iron transporter
VLSSKIHPFFCRENISSDQCDGIVDDIGKDLSALAVQAATGLLAIVVLLVVMNWFFHKLYWTRWISLHNQRKRQLLGREKKADGAL